MNCCGNCDQGRKPCVTPITCGLDPEEDSDPLRTARALLETAAFAALIWAIVAYLVFVFV